MMPQMKIIEMQRPKPTSRLSFGGEVSWRCRCLSAPTQGRHSRGRPVNGSDCSDEDRHSECPEHSLPPHEVAKRWRSGVSEGGGLGGGGG